MKKFLTPGTRSALLLTVLLGITACDAPEFGGEPAEPQLSSVSAATLLECTVATPGAAQAVILAGAGGTIELGGNSVVVPAEALLDPTEIAIAVPESPHVRVDLTADGQEHWQFQAPVTITIDYSRCDQSTYAGKTLSVWLLDSESGALVEHMGGTDNRTARQITFTTDHFSGYAIAN